jgi:hypothetical protein
VISTRNAGLRIREQKLTERKILRSVIGFGWSLRFGSIVAGGSQIVMLLYPKALPKSRIIGFAKT